MIAAESRYKSDVVVPRSFDFCPRGSSKCEVARPIDLAFFFIVAKKSDLVLQTISSITALVASLAPKIIMALMRSSTMTRSPLARSMCGAGALAAVSEILILSLSRISPASRAEKITYNAINFVNGPGSIVRDAFFSLIMTPLDKSPKT